jgi:hypothetical protein
MTAEDDAVKLGRTHLTRFGIHIEEIDHFLDKLERYHYDTYEKIDRNDVRTRLIYYFGLITIEKIDA